MVILELSLELSSSLPGVGELEDTRSKEGIGVGEGELTCHTVL